MTSTEAEESLAADARLVAQIRAGDREAGQRFVRECYPAIYHYLLYLTGRPETAEDLTQETFVRAWRRIETFEGRAPLRLWLHRIAHREFLRALRRQRPENGAADLDEVAAPRVEAWTEAVELREVIRALPAEEREIVALHYLQGYNCREIAGIVGAPSGTVKYRLSMARARLQRALGEGDLSYLNQPPAAGLRRWGWPAGEISMKETTSAGMSRRQLLGAAGSAVAAAAAASLTGATAAPPNEAEIVDDRLARKVTVAVKAMALSDLCAQLEADTGIRIAAGPSVADEKVTLFCEKLPLREVMRQLSRPFGYTWVRSQTADGRRQTVDGSPKAEGSQDRSPTADYRLPSTVYRYELVQDLRSQLLEEELRNRDRNAALVAVDEEMQQYRPLLDLSPDEALARAKSAGEGEKKRLEALGGAGWGPIQMYFRLAPAEQAALLAGKELKFGQEPKAGERPLPPDVARGVLQSQRDLHMVRESNGKGDAKLRQARPDELGGLPPSALPEARAVVTLKLDQTELGRFGFSGSSEVIINGSDWGNDTGPYAAGQSHAALQPQNGAVNAALARDPALQVKVTVELNPTPRPPSLQGKGESAASASEHGSDVLSPPSPFRGGAGGGVVPVSEKLTSADVLEALHRATHMPIIADFYTRMYGLEAVIVKEQPLFEALNHLADALRLRWKREDGWLQFRSVSFYNDRPKEVPNRLLSRWAAARREHGHLMLDDLIEIAGLSDTQLDARDMAEGAKLIWGLEEWGLAGNRALRPHLRWMAGFTLAQRQKVQQPPGLRFTELSLTQQQQFISMAMGDSADAVGSLEELATAAVQIDYSLPGQFEWQAPEKPGGGTPDPPSPVRAATREAALAAARGLDPQADPTQIQPTRLEITLSYHWGTPRSNGAYRLHTTGPGDTGIGRWRNKEDG